MFGSSGEYIQFPGAHSSVKGNSVFWGKQRNGQISREHQGRENQELGLASTNMGLLAPALVGTGAFFLLSQLFRVEGTRKERGSSVAGKMASIIYTGIATVGISYYIYNVLIAAGSRPLYAFLPFSWAIWVMLLYYASVYNWIYRLYPGSLTGDFGETPLDQFVSFMYFSISTFSTGGWGGMSPNSNTAKILVSLQLLFFVFIFTTGLVFFINP